MLPANQVSYLDCDQGDEVFRWDPLKLLFYYGIMTVVFSAVLNNVTAMIIVGSLTLSRWKN